MIILFHTMIRFNLPNFIAMYSSSYSGFSTRLFILVINPSQASTEMSHITHEKLFKFRPNIRICLQCIRVLKCAQKVIF